MSRLLLLATASLLIVLPAAPARGQASPPGMPVLGAAAQLPTPPLAARGGGRGGGRIGSRPRRPLSPAQRAAQQRRTQQRNRAVGRAFRGVLRVLGIAFLLNFLFGWGAGGSAWGLFLLAGLIALFVISRRRRRRQFAHPRY